MLRHGGGVQWKVHVPELQRCVEWVDKGGNWVETRQERWRRCCVLPLLIPINEGKERIVVMGSGWLCMSLVLGMSG